MGSFALICRHAFVDLSALARHCGLIDTDISFNYHSVGRDLLTCFKKYNVAYNDIFNGDLAYLSVTAHLVGCLGKLV